MNKQTRIRPRKCCVRFYSAALLWTSFCLTLPWAVSLHIIAQKAAPPARDTDSPFASAEVLRYSVRWSFVRLGSIELRQKPASNAAGAFALVTLSARSASGLPFIDVHVRDRSVLDASDPRCRDFTVRKEHEPASVKKYTYDRNSRTLAMEITEAGQPSVRRQRVEQRDFYDALGVIMLLRGLAGSGERITIPMLMDFEIVHSKACCPREIEDISVSAFDDDVPAHRITLRSSWEDESVGGLGGDIDLWCSADAAAIPLRAEMELTLGSIVIELESCTRSGWSRRSIAGSGDSAGSVKGGAR